MKLLEERIRKDGEVLDGDVLKINSFLNHQVDPELMMQVGENSNVYLKMKRSLKFLPVKLQELHLVLWQLIN